MALKRKKLPSKSKYLNVSTVWIDFLNEYLGLLL